MARSGPGPGRAVPHGPAPTGRAGGGSAIKQPRRETAQGRDAPHGPALTAPPPPPREPAPRSALSASVPSRTGQGRAGMLPAPQPGTREFPSAPGGAPTLTPSPRSALPQAPSHRSAQGPLSLVTHYLHSPQKPPGIPVRVSSPHSRSPLLSRVASAPERHRHYPLSSHRECRSQGLPKFGSAGIEETELRAAIFPSLLAFFQP
ncbi:nematocyst expressed protein 3-like [Ammospiza caudacuta]|uniref:nematocyst expressed protein 3-like n=1 Tax=Ammospiza caudacuta TaxID=2857398 RepID=UPI0027384B4C|nr:nematocyst expressed protein 3-like [Ammospiza caudacuta]